MAYQYGGNGNPRGVLDRMAAIAGFSNGSAWLPVLSPGDAAEFRNAQAMLPYEQQAQQARFQEEEAEAQRNQQLLLQQRGALQNDYQTRQQYRYQYGI